MKIETEPREDHQVKVVAEFETSVLDKYKQQAARKISREAKIPGFRPGKAPFSVIRRMYGDQAIQEQAVEIMLDEIYPEILKEADIQPTYQGSLEEILSFDPPKFSFIIPLNPEVKLGNYREIRKEYTAEPVSEEKIDAFIKRMLTSYATAEPAERPAQEGDLVYVKVTGTLVHPDEGEEAELIHETPFQVVIGDNTMSEDTWPFPGFSKELVGLSANEEKDVPYVYPEDFEPEKLRGKEIVFHAVIQSVKSMKVPELNEEFIQTLGGGYDTVDSLREGVRKQLETSEKQEYERKFFNELVDDIIAGSEIKYPPQMLEEEEHQVLHNIEHDLEHQRMDLDTYLKLIESDKETFMKDQVRPIAVRRLQRSLVLDQIARDEEIKVQNNELQSAFNEAFMELQQSTEDMQKLQKQLSNERLSEMLTYEAASRALNRRVMSRLKSIATGQPEESIEENADSAPEAVGEETNIVAEAAETPESTGTTPENTDDTPKAAPES